MPAAVDPTAVDGARGTNWLSLFTLSGGDFFTLCGVGVLSSRSNYQTLACGVHNLTRDCVQRVDLQETGNLGDEPMEQAEIAAGNAYDCCHGFLVCDAVLW
jgi:hypothetical protein